MATADCQKITITFGVPISPAVISRFNRIWSTRPQARSSTTLIWQVIMIILLPLPQMMDEYMDTFFDTEATKEAVIQAGTAIFQYIYRAPDSPLGKIRYNMFSMKGGGRSDQTRDSTSNRGYICAAFTPCYQQTRHWILLQSMSLNPIDYGWTLGVHGWASSNTIRHGSWRVTEVHECYISIWIKCYLKCKYNG